MKGFVNYSKLIWVPRILTIIFILFFSLFALDAFTGNARFLEKILEFLIHLIPSFFLLILLIISWKQPLIIGYVFIILGIVFTFFLKHIISN